MLGQLILKDIKAHWKKIFLKTAGAWLMLGGLFFFVFFPWQVYFIHACMAVAFASSTYIISDKSRQAELLSCSLPTNRYSIVVARYLTTGIIVAIVLVMWLFIAWIGEHLFSASRTHFADIFRGEIVFLLLIFQIIHFSLFLPAGFKTGMMGSIITFTLGILSAIITIVFIFNYHSGFLWTQLVQASWHVMVSISIILLFILIFSINLAFFLIKIKEY